MLYNFSNYQAAKDMIKKSELKRELDGNHENA